MILAYNDDMVLLARALSDFTEWVEEVTGYLCTLDMHVGFSIAFCVQIQKCNFSRTTSSL